MQSLFELRQINMRQTITALMLVLNMLVCRYACSGWVFASDSGDPCCPKQDSHSDSPRAPQDNCDGSCGNCLCGGAVTGNELRSDFEAAPNASFHSYLPPTISEPLGLGGFQAVRLRNERAIPTRSGAMLRAVIQSFLL